MTAAWDLRQHWPAAENEHKDISLLEYSSGVLAAIAVALIYVAGAAVHDHSEKAPLNFGLGRVEIIGWSLLSHVLVAIIVISILNLIRLITRHARRPTSLRLVLNGMAIALVIGIVLDYFLASALSFEGWAAHLYATLLAVTLYTFLRLSGLALPVGAGRAGPTALNPHSGQCFCHLPSSSPPWRLPCQPSLAEATGMECSRVPSPYFSGSF